MNSTLPPHLAALAAALLTACAGAKADRPTTKPAGDTVAAAPADVQAAARSGNGFAMSMYSQLAAQPQNFAFSPSSISIALAMTYAGAKGETAEQMKKALNFELEPDALHAANQQQLAAWNDPKRTAYELAVVNRLFGEKTAKFEPSFVDLTSDSYGAPLEPLDFRTAPEPSRVRINGWIADQTKEKIKDLLPSGSIDPDTRLVLTNAVYFKGTWKHEFDKKATVDADFHTLAGAAVQVPMMNLSATLPYANIDGVHVLELPYAGDELAMDILLPVDRDGLKSMETAMAKADLEDWFAKLSPTEVQLGLPRFKLDPPDAIALKPQLTALGMPKAFDRTAEFEGMSPIKPLYIDDVFHKAFVEVNEKGTEAAAATAVVMRTESASIEPEPIHVTADHAFAFAIRDLRSGAILFLGRVANPNA